MHVKWILFLIQKFEGSVDPSFQKELARSKHLNEVFLHQQKVVECKEKARLNDVSEDKLSSSEKSHLINERILLFNELKQNFKEIKKQDKKVKTNLAERTTYLDKIIKDKWEHKVDLEKLVFKFSQTFEKVRTLGQEIIENKQSGWFAWLSSSSVNKERIAREWAEDFRVQAWASTRDKFVLEEEEQAPPSNDDKDAIAPQPHSNELSGSQE